MYFYDMIIHPKQKQRERERERERGRKRKVNAIGIENFKPFV